MIEENVVSAAGAHNRADEKTLRYLISETGFIPQQRDILYRYVNRKPPSGVDDLKTTILPETTLAAIS